MPRTQRWRLAYGLVWAVLQFALPLGVSYLDGRLASDAAPAQSHVEAEGSSTCPAVHSLECGLCRFLSAYSASPAKPLAAVEVREAADACLPTPPDFARAVTGQRLRTRAPPAI
jgi:hypothetical protein